MKEIKNIPVKIKKVLYNNIVQAILVSFFTTLLVISAFLFLFLSHKADVITFFTKEYKSQQEIIPQFKVPITNKKVKKRNYFHSQKNLIKKFLL